MDKKIRKLALYMCLNLYDCKTGNFIKYRIIFPKNEFYSFNPEVNANINIVTLHYCIVLLYYSISWSCYAEWNYRAVLANDRKVYYDTASIQALKYYKDCRFPMCCKISVWS